LHLVLACDDVTCLLVDSPRQRVEGSVFPHHSADKTHHSNLNLT
jgi:hypothetical protein